MRILRNYSIKDMIWKNKGHEFDKYAEMILDNRKKVVACGNNSEINEFHQRVGKYLADDAYECIIDETDDVEKNMYYEDCIQKIDNAIIVCTYKERKKYEKFLNYWIQRGFVENISFFQGEVFEMVYEVYARDYISIDRIEIFLTSCCTLNCEKCISYIPYFKKQTITPLDELKADVDLLFKKVDYVKKIKLLGGEVFLYPYLIEYIDYLYKKYGNRIGSIRVGTNGTVFPSSSVLEMCKRNHVTVDISDYTEAVPNICMLEEVKKVCEDNGVSVDVKRTGEQWLDMGFPNNIPGKKSEKELREHFSKCAMFCRQFREGRYYYCCSNFAAVVANLFQENTDDYFDFHTEFTKKELLEYEIGYNRIGHTSFCNVCRGCSEEVNSLRVEVAKQITRGA